MGTTDLTIMILRLCERIFAVGIAGVTIYFGFKLFTLLPTQSDNSGKISLPGFKVVLSKVGPGIFFAALGSLILYQSFTSPIQLNGDTGKFVGATGFESIPTSPTSEPSRSDTPSTAKQLAEVRQTLQILNCMEQITQKPESGLHADDVEESTRKAKISLVESVWDNKKWGEKITFRKWAQTLQGTIPDDLRQLYGSIMLDCPK